MLMLDAVSDVLGFLGREAVLDRMRNRLADLDSRLRNVELATSIIFRAKVHRRTRARMARSSPARCLIAICVTGVRGDAPHHTGWSAVDRSQFRILFFRSGFAITDHQVGFGIRGEIVAISDALVLQYSDLNGFLHAEVGVEAGGMTLSVLSTLARLGKDPWQEAARLALMPKAAAGDALAHMIAATPTSRWPLSEAMAIAARLVILLPSPNVHAGAATKSNAWARKQWIVLSGIVILATGLMQVLMSHLP